MKVLVLAPKESFPPPLEGGGEIFQHCCCEQLRHLGHQVQVLAAAAEGDSDFDAEQSYLVRRFPVYGSRVCTAIIVIIYSIFYALRDRVDVVLIGLLMTFEALGVWVLWKALRLPYVLLIHGMDLKSTMKSRSRIHKAVTRTVLKNASMVLANSRFTEKVIAEAGYEGRIVILNPGVDIERFRPGLPTADVRRKYEIKATKVILSVSRLVERKGHADVLRALPLVVQQVPDVVYLIAGRGEEEGNLRTLVRDLGLQEYVRFAGYVDNEELPHLYCACDAFVLPATYIEATGSYEGFGIVFSEASACAKPTIGGNCGGVRDAVIDGITGIIVDSGDFDSIARALIKVLIDDQYAQSLGNQGRLRVKQELTWPIVASKLERALESLIRTDGRISENEFCFKESLTEAKKEI